MDSLFANFFVQLPPEIWLQVFVILSPSDRYALSLTCRILFEFVHSFAPFRVANILGGRPLDVRAIKRLPTILRCAVEAHWEPSSVRRYGTIIKRNSSTLFSSHGLSFRMLLHSLVHCPQLRHLSISNIDVAPPQQEVILTLPRLQTLSLKAAQFIPTSRAMPASSLIKLRFVHDPGIEGTRYYITHAPYVKYLVTRLAASLTTIEFTMSARHFSHSLFSNSIPHLPHLPNLTTIVQAYPSSFADKDLLPFLRKNPSVTTLSTYVSNSEHWPFSDMSFLPRLHTLICHPVIAEALIPGRPVRTYHQQLEYLRPCAAPGIASLLPCLAQGSAMAGLTELQLVTWVTLKQFLVILEQNLPRIQRLYVWLDGEKIYNIPHPAFDYWPHDIRRSSSKTERIGPFPTLKDIRVFFDKEPKEHSLLEGCRSFFRDWIEPACPVLQTALFAAAATYEDMKSEEFQSGYYLRLERQAGGWEELQLLDNQDNH